MSCNLIIKNGTIEQSDENSLIKWSIKLHDEYVDIDGTIQSMYITNKIMEMVDWEDVCDNLKDRISSGEFNIILTNTTNISYETVEKISSLIKKYQQYNIFFIMHTHCIAPLSGVVPYCTILNGTYIDTSHDHEFRTIIKTHKPGAPIYDIVVYIHLYRFLDIVYEEFLRGGVDKTKIVGCIIDCLSGIRLGKNNKSFVHIQHLFNRLEYEQSCLQLIS
jgi:hypothetical protein